MNSDKLKILLVEDNYDIYMDVKIILEEEGYAVLEIENKLLIDNYDDAITLCNTTIPDMAILDIEIKGSKDGIEIGRYIRDNFECPVIFLSGKNSDENLRRSGMLNADGFVVKLSKPLDLTQLKADIKRKKEFALLNREKRKNEGVFFLCREIIDEIKYENEFYRIKISWNYLIFIRTYPAKDNSISFHLKNGKKYLHHTSLSSCKALLPPFFLRFSNKEIINSRYFTRRGKSQWVYYINDDRYEVSETYRTDEMLDQLKKLPF